MVSVYVLWKFKCYLALVSMGKEEMERYNTRMLEHCLCRYVRISRLNFDVGLIWLWGQIGERPEIGWYSGFCR